MSLFDKINAVKKEIEGYSHTFAYVLNGTGAPSAGFDRLLVPTPPRGRAA